MELAQQKMIVASWILLAGFEDDSAAARAQRHADW